MWTATIATAPDRAFRQQRDNLVELLQATTRGGWLTAKGIIGTARTIESEHGDHGWHVHAHTLLVFGNEFVRTDARSFALALRARYLREAERLGIGALPAGQHVVVAKSDSALIRYVTKSGVRVHGYNTESRLWRDAVGGDAEALALIHELEAGAFRRRAWTTTGVCRPIR